MGSSRQVLGWALIGLACLPTAVRAQMLSYTRGAVYSNAVSKVESAYKVEYRQLLYKDISTTFDYVNEGHFPGHHRDGYGWEFWYRVPISKTDHVSLFAGVGPYYYFDTVTSVGGLSTDIHGLAPILTLSARGQLWKKLDWTVSADWIHPSTDFKSEILTAGVGYWLSAEPGSAGGGPLGFFERTDAATDTRRNELSVYGVFSVINISGNPSSWGASAEYRYRFQRNFDGTVTYIYEGDPRVARRNGLSAQVWPVRTDITSGIEIGAGFGAYVFVDTKHQPIPGQITTAAVAPIISLMLSFPAQSEWFGRLIWDRVVSNYSRDADIWRLGFGMNF